MIAHGEDLHIDEVFSRTFSESDGVFKLRKVVKLEFLRKPDAARSKGIRSCRATALTSVMSKRYASCILLRLEKKSQKNERNYISVDWME